MIRGEFFSFRLWRNISNLPMANISSLREQTYRVAFRQHIDRAVDLEFVVTDKRAEVFRLFVLTSCTVRCISSPQAYRVRFSGHIELPQGNISTEQRLGVCSC